MPPEPPSSPEKQSFWSTLPGILAQLAALIGAITALLALLLPHCHKGIIDGSPTPTPSPTALTPAQTATPTATPPSPPPKRKGVLLQAIDLEVIQKGPNKQIDDDVIFTVTKGIDTLATLAISAKPHPWRISQNISLTFRSPIHVHDIDNLRLTVSKKPHLGQDLVLTMAISGRMSDGRTPMLLDSTQFDLGRGRISGHESSHEFKLKRPVE
jgi:hypothetical protein